MKYHIQSFFFPQTHVCRVKTYSVMYKKQPQKNNNTMKDSELPLFRCWETGRADLRADDSWLTEMTGSNLAAWVWFAYDRLSSVMRDCTEGHDVWTGGVWWTDDEWLDEGTVQWFTVQWEAVLHIRHFFLDKEEKKTSFQHEHVIRG